MNNPSLPPTSASASFQIGVPSYVPKGVDGNLLSGQKGGPRLLKLDTLVAEAAFHKSWGLQKNGQILNLANRNFEADKYFIKIVINRSSTKIY